jgi:hypothetical protein
MDIQSARGDHRNWEKLELWQPQRANASELA